MTINVSPAMINAGLAMGATTGALHIDCEPCRRALPDIYTTMEQARLDEDKALRAEATAARARDNRPWPQAG